MCYGEKLLCVRKIFAPHVGSTHGHSKNPILFAEFTLHSLKGTELYGLYSAGCDDQHGEDSLAVVAN
jgi:hypothetical protein